MLPRTLASSSPARRLGRPLGRIALAAAVCVASASTALAQPRKDEPLRPPVPPSGGSNWSPVYSMLVGIVVGGLVLGVAFIPSKRGHQD